MSFELIVSVVALAIIIIWGIAWEQQKEKLYVRIERLEEDVRELVKDVDELREKGGLP
jgi:hypothetical protein